MLDHFFATQSRVIRLYNLPQMADMLLSSVFSDPEIPTPTSFWGSDEQDSIWAAFQSHEQACAALFLLSATTMSVAPTLEHDIEPLRRLQLKDYPISSNPPNSRTSFRLGDWICSTPTCAAHNFGRNQVCIGCGCPRTNLRAVTPCLPSPRFSSSPASLSPTSYSFPTTPQSPSFPPSPVAKTNHPLLTPSGRAFALGGKVQNISNDPLSPCVMYWPDNEPFPEQGQIRPSTLVGVPQPPILNTGNRGPISHQPGDWICQKCNYLNWRRRKVCQTCLPYAEGNGDSISAAVQAERIALLTSVLSQNHAPSWQRSQSMTPPQVRRPFIDISPPNSRGPVHRSQSHFELGSQYSAHRPIYQTSGHRQPSPLTLPLLQPRLQVHAPAPLLPSFLQDIVQSPTGSPESTSTDLSFEGYETFGVGFSRPRSTHLTSDSSSSNGSIWTLDGEESKAFPPFHLHHGPGLHSSQEFLKPLHIL